MTMNRRHSHNTVQQVVLWKLYAYITCVITLPWHIWLMCGLNELCAVRSTD